MERPTGSLGKAPPAGSGSSVTSAGMPPAIPPGKPTTRRLRNEIATRTGPGSTIQLGVDYLAYARQKLSPPVFKRELEQRIVPAVGKGPSPVAGAPFGKFEVRSFLGKGGMAEVFLAFDSESHKDVALKVMRDDLSTDGNYVRRFLREAANAGLIDHPNVVKVLEVGAVVGRLYFTMEAVQGETLKERLAKKPFGEVEGVHLLEQIVAGLNACHERGIVHRDMKPSNVMLAVAGSKYGFALDGDPTFTVKLMDFGLSRQLQDDDEPELENEGRILGTAKYVAPELVAGQMPTLQSDIFSLGIMAYQVFSGRAPWKAKEKVEYLEANLNQEAPPLETVAPGISTEVATLVSAMLEKNPTERPTSTALQRDLERLSRRGKPGERVSVTDDTSSVFHVERAPRIAKQKRRDPAKEAPSTPLVALAVIVGIVLTLLVLVIVVQLGKQPPEPEPTPRPPVDRASPSPRPSARPSSLPSAGPSAAPSPDAPVREQDAGLRKGTLPASLATLGMTIGDTSARDHFKTFLDNGDHAWQAGRWVEAREAWREALDLLGPNDALQLRVFRAERELALEKADQLESQGQIQEALDALDEAVAKGAASAPLEERRTKLKARASLEGGWKDALAESRELVARGDFDRAVERLKSAREVAEKLGCSPELDRQLAAVDDARRAGESTVQARELVAKARGFLEAGEVESAALTLKRARALSPDVPGLALLEKRVTRIQRAGPGMVWLELDPATGKGLYARKTAVSNKELKAWIDSAPPGKRRHGPWISGSFPDDQADDPVKGVKLDDAKAFAEAQHQRLPTTEERAALQKALALPDKESLPDSRNAFANGFRTVADAPEDRP